MPLLKEIIYRLEKHTYIKALEEASELIFMVSCQSFTGMVNGKRRCMMSSVKIHGWL
jgi:hypothetical protein